MQSLLRIERNAWPKNNGQGWIRRCGDGLSTRERLAPVAIDVTAVLSAKERLAPVAVIGMDEGTDDGTDDDEILG
jgi:hypothetical protein